MDAEQIAREYLEASHQRIVDDELAPDITDAEVCALCRAVLDAAEYRKRVEAVAQGMRGYALASIDEDQVRRFVIQWAEQLTETGNGPK